MSALDQKPVEMRERSVSFGRWFQAYWCPGLLWFRVNGRGWHIKDTARHRLLFSEREGHRTFWTARRLSPDPAPRSGASE